MAYFNFYARFYSFASLVKSSFAEIFKFKSSFFYLALVSFWQIVAWFQAWFISHNLSGKFLVLHYNVDFGIDLVDSPGKIYLYPFLGLSVFLINIFILAFFSKNKNFKIISHFLFGAATVFTIFIVIALTSIYLINFL